MKPRSDKRRTRVVRPGLITQIVSDYITHQAARYGFTTTSTFAGPTVLCESGDKLPECSDNLILSADVNTKHIALHYHAGMFYMPRLGHYYVGDRRYRRRMRIFDYNDHRSFRSFLRHVRDALRITHQRIIARKQALLVNG